MKQITNPSNWTSPYLMAVAVPVVVIAVTGLFLTLVNLVK